RCEYSPRSWSARPCSGRVGPSGKQSRRSVPGRTPAMSPHHTSLQQVTWCLPQPGPWTQLLQQRTSFSSGSFADYDGTLIVTQATHDCADHLLIDHSVDHCEPGPALHSTEWRLILHGEAELRRDCLGELTVGHPLGEERAAIREVIHRLADH